MQLPSLSDLVGLLTASFFLMEHFAGGREDWRRRAALLRAGEEEETGGRLWDSLALPGMQTEPEASAGSL